MSEKLELLHTDRVLIVEGKYDAARLSHLTDAMILLTDGSSNSWPTKTALSS